MQRLRQDTMFATVVLTSLAVALIGCGGGSEASSPPLPSSAAALVSLSPGSVIVGGNGFTLAVNGSNFASSTIVRWNGQSVPTTFVSSQEVTATISPSLVASAGFASVSAQNANSSVSNALQFRINNPAPQITSISPDNAMVGAAPLLLTVSGSSFISGATLLLDGTARPITSQTATQLQTIIPASGLADARSVAVTVANPEPAAGPSNQTTFTVNPFTSNPAPTVTSSSDASVPAGWPGFEITVTGTNFVAESLVQWNGLNRPTTVVSSTELKAAIAPEQLASPGAVQLSVVNGSPGGGASSPLTIQIEGFPPDAVGVIDRANIGSDFSEANDNSDFPGVSGGGRFVVFRSAATNLVSDTAESGSYAFLRDTCTGAPAGCVPSLTRVSHSDYRPAISANGRYLGISYAGNIFLHDTCFGALTGCVPRDLGVDGSNADSSPVSLSADGRYAAYLAGCSPWDYGCDPGTQVFLADTCAGASSGCTPSSLAIAQTGQITEDVELVHPVLSPDGRFVIFNASDNDIWLFDSCRGQPASCSPSKTMVSAAGDGSPANAESFGSTISAGGRYVAFVSSATNLVPSLPDTGGFRVYVRDMCIGASSGCTPTTSAVAVSGEGTAADGVSISADGRYIGFGSGATDLVSADTNGAQDIFVRDTCAGVSSGCTPSTVRVSVALDGTQGNGGSGRPVISADGRFVVFISAAKLGPGSPNSLGSDVYLARH